MTKEQIAAIAVVLLLGVVFFVRLYRRQQEPPKEPTKPRPLPKTVGVSVVWRLRLDQIKFGYKNNPVKCG